MTPLEDTSRPIDALPVNSPEWWDEYFRAHWDENGGAEQTRHFMQRLIAELPSSLAAHIEAKGASILDWGCAHGEGVDELATAFPRARVLGIDASSVAIDEARRRFPGRAFEHSGDGAIPQRVDIVVSSNCLEHFDEPEAVARELARSAKQLLVLLVPYAEEPLCASHRSRFDEQTLPEELEGMRRRIAKRIPVDARHWGGEQLLLVYATPQCELEQAVDGVCRDERAKWDAHYASTRLEAESAAMARFGAEFAALVSRLLPDGGRVLEAGAGAGWHSLALARTGRFEVTLLDFSEHALRHARELFAREGLAAEFVLGDAREHGERSHDLVFNSGVLEHFAPAEQARFVAAMASRSRGLVLAMVPNRRCYWYWLWRLQAVARGDWSFGKEVPASTLREAFAAAGVDWVGERVIGQDWTETFFDYVRGMDRGLQSQLLALHRSPVLADDVKGYLLAGLGRVESTPALDGPALAQWRDDRPPGSGDATQDALAASLADALALQVRAGDELAAARRRVDELARGLDVSRSEAAALAERAGAAAAHGEDAARLATMLEQAHRRADAEAEERARLQQALAGLEAERRQLASALENEATARDTLRRQDEAQCSANDELAAELATLRRERQSLVEWRAAIERSRAFRLLKAFDRWRDRIRWRRDGRRAR